MARATRMETQRRRNRNLIFTSWIFLVHQTCPSVFVDAFSPMAIMRSSPMCRQQRCRDGGDASQPALLTQGAPLLDTRRSPNLIRMAASAGSATESGEVASPPSAKVDDETAADAAADDDYDKLDMPWSEVQDWALRDNLSKFTVVIQPPITGGKPRRYAMWRTLTREVPELAGYPIPFLMQMHQRISKKDGKKAGKLAIETPGVLPMVDDFEFAPNGGVSGRAYGLPGIADGTRVQTPPLVSAETTVPLGYVTAEGDKDSEGNGVGFSYELGTCASSGAYSLDGTERSAALAAARRMVLDGAAGSSKQVASVAKEMAVSGSGLLSDAEANRDLVYLGGATAMLLASATAVGMLSHHLTVNVFWV